MPVVTFARRVFGVSLFASLNLLAGTALADDPTFSLSASGTVGVTNSSVNPFIIGLNSASSTDGSPITASATASFTGKDRTGTTRTMTFTGLTTASATYGQLHVYSTGTLSNSYFNAANPVYTQPDQGPPGTGSPDGVASIGFADFNDTLQFGGALQAGYKARYIFHADGTNSGTGGFADLSVTIAGHNEAFFATDPGSINTIWATQDYEINGQTPQTVNVQFSDQFTAGTADLADGSTVTGTSDFSATATLVGIEIVDANGNQVSGVTVSGDSGVTYSTAVPEPASIAGLMLAAVGLLRRRRTEGF